MVSSQVAFSAWMLLGSFPERMIVMKRLAALLLSLVLLTLLSMPALAETAAVATETEKDIPVTLTVDSSQMVDVTITWSELDYTHDGNKFAVTADTMPSITVTNNNPQTTVVMNPSYVPENSTYSDDAFWLNFFEDPNHTVSNHSNIANVVISNGSPKTFYAVPSGNPYTHGLSTAKELKVGTVRITIELPQS